jgi:uncharacterized protein YndB with AHSA1/START domain
VTVAGDRASVSVRVDVTPTVAFDVFTKEIDLWWGKGPAYRIGGKQPGVLSFEPGAGGRLLETYGAGKVHVAGTITIWEPPSRLSFEWRSITFTPDQRTFVDVTFEPSGDAATLVTVVHHGWATIPDDHRVRHGATGAAFIARIGTWWGSLMTSLREHAAGR